MFLKDLLLTKWGSILISIVLGFGLAALFQKACKDNNCVIIKGPPYKDIKDKIYSENAISIYPNPSHGEFSVQSSKALEMKIINELGQVIKLISLNENNNYKMEVQNIPSGIYFITNEKASINQKVIIEK